MVKHIILWKLKDMPEQEKQEQLRLVKSGLEGLKGKIAGMVDVHVQIDKLSTSNADMMLSITFDSEGALAEYAKNPEHNAVADRYIRPYIETRLCLDYQV